jgi:hypothetical protein
MYVEAYHCLSACLSLAVLPNRGLSYYFPSLLEPVNAFQCLSMHIPSYCADSVNAYLSLHWS